MLRPDARKQDIFPFVRLTVCAKVISICRSQMYHILLCAPRGEELEPCLSLSDMPTKSSEKAG